MNILRLEGSTKQTQKTRGAITGWKGRPAPPNNNLLKELLINKVSEM